MTRERLTSIAVHALEARSRANGPGARYVIWFQGCSLGCPGCFNPRTHEPAARSTVVSTGPVTSSMRSNIAPGTAWTVEALVADILAQGDAIEGVTLSGGEPFEQPEAALALIEALRAQSRLSVLAFSGYTLEELRALPRGAALLEGIDVLVDGRYQAPQRLGRGLRGSRNQRVHILTARYRREEVEATPEAEIRIDADGRVVLTGVDPLKVRALLK